MKAKKILFVGGPSDGHRKPDPCVNYTNVAELKLNPAWLTAAYEDDCVGYDVSTYTKKQFIGPNGQVYEAFFHSSITDPMEALLKGYHYHRNPRPAKGVLTAGRLNLIRRTMNACTP